MGRRGRRPSPDELAAALRAGAPPVIGRIADQRLLLDLRSVDPREDDDLAEVIAGAARGSEDAGSGPDHT